jgi:hypothetical protein
MRDGYVSVHNQEHIGMRRMLAGAAIAAMLSAALLAQAGITGKWQGKTPAGSDVTLDLTATKTALTGTLSEGGRTIKLADGKVTKNTFKFTATMNEEAVAFSGELVKDELRVWMDRNGPEKSAILKRVETKK